MFDQIMRCMYNACTPTIFVLGAFKILIFTRDHLPAHVHCKSSDGEVLIAIQTLEVIRNHGVHTSDVKRLKEFIAKNEDVLMIEWRHYHEEN